MECSSWKMIEQAKEELQILETLHPNRFDYLKLELKSFIFFLESQHNNNDNNNENNNLIYYPSSSTATTQASTNNRKRKKAGIGMGSCRNEEMKNKFQRVLGEFKRRDRIDLVLEKAQSCLRKIKELKSSLC
ncbi:hypothetical protein Pint_31110 [Pistacia integerrima]|uniref:Uncharacterized protein n=1 Tax=Pistacia integerrima TaxID=434235 RepID=A0ACC0XRX9_9ROSI|nr:hypothetical protein Pint_31110 [Pistacia integerrima]